MSYPSNNKKLGTDFEQEAVELLAKLGYWVHFIVPDTRGAQPFDIIAVKNGIPYAIDCKTCVAKSFNISRLEENQVLSFGKWLKCGNTEPLILVKHNGYIYVIGFNELRSCESIRLGPRKNHFAILEERLNECLKQSE